MVFFLEEIVAVVIIQEILLVLRPIRVELFRIVKRFRKSNKEKFPVYVKEPTFSDFPVVQMYSTDDTYFENFPPIY